MASTIGKYEELYLMFVRNCNVIIQILQVFNNTYDDYVICVECCNKINSFYAFSNKCIKNLNTFNYIGKFNSSNSYGVSVKTPIREKAVDYKQLLEQDKSTTQNIDVMGNRNMTENRISSSINNVKLETFDEDYDRIHSVIHLKLDSDVLSNVELFQEVDTKTQVKQCDLLKDISKNVQGCTEVKIEEDENVKCLDYEFVACEDVRNFCEITGKTS